MLNETALIPQGMVGIRVGQRGRIRTVPYPDCTCGKVALVSVPQGAETLHRCMACLTEPSVLDILAQLGII